MPVVTVSLWQSAVDGILTFIDLAGQQAELQTRELLPPLGGSVDQRIDFTTFAVIEKMAFDSKTGKTTFAGVGIERKLNDEAFFEWIPNVTTELFVLFQNNRYEILNVDDIGELNGILKLDLQLTGEEIKEASKS